MTIHKKVVKSLADGEIIIESRVDAQKAEKDLKDLEKSVKQTAKTIEGVDVVVEADADTDKAEEKLEQVTKQAKAVEKEKPKVKVDADTAVADQKVLRVKASFANLSTLRSMPRIGAETTEAETKVGRIKATLENISKIKAQARVFADTVSADQRIARLKTALHNLATIFKVDADTKPAETKVKNLSSQIVGLAAGFGALVGVKDLIGKAIGRTDTIDTATKSLTVLTGSADSAKLIMSDLSEAIKGTPIALDQVALGTKKMVAAGMQGDKVKGVFTAIADAAYGVGNGTESIDQMTSAISSLQSSGVAYSDDINRMVDAGVPAWQILANQTGKSVGEVKEYVSSGSLSSVDAIDMLVDGIENGTNGVGGATAKMAGLAKTAGSTISGSFANAKTTVVKSLTNITDGLKGPIIEALDSVQAGFNSFGTVTSEIGNSLKQAFDANGFVGAAEVLGSSLSRIVEVALSALPGLLDTGIQVAAAFIKGFASSLPELIPTIVTTLTSIITTFIDNIPLLIDTGMQLLNGLFDGLMAAIPLLIEQLPLIIQKIADGLILGLPMILDTGVKLLSALITNLPTIISNIIGSLPEIISAIIRTLISAIPMLIDAGLQLLTSLIANLPQIITTIVTALPAIIMAIIEAIVDNIPVIIKAGFQLLVALIENLPEIIVAIVKAVPEIIQGLVNAFDSGMKNIADIGMNILKGIWQGIQSGWNWFIGEISNIGNNIVDNFKNVLGIHSPSTVFRDMIGVNIVRGIGEGFDSELPSLKSAIKTGVSGLSTNATVDVKTTMTNIAPVPVEETTDEGKQLSNQWALIKQRVHGIVDQLHQGTQSKFNVAYNMVNSLTNTFTGLVVQQWQRMLSQIIVVLDRMYSVSVDKFNSTKGAVIAIMNDLPAQLYGIGSSAIERLVSGIQSRQVDADNAASSLVQSVVAKFKEGFGINSPSRVMFEMGAYLIEGMINGLKGDDLMQFVDKMITDMKVAFEGGNFDILKTIKLMGDGAGKLFEKLGIKLGNMSGALFGSGGMLFPTDNKTITSYFGYRDDTGGVGSSNHQGIDIGAGMGEPIYAALPGKVELAGSNGGYGNCVVIDHGGGLKTLYGHMSAVGTSEGANIAQGQVIGMVGNTGNSTGPHLHFSVLMNGEQIDPLKLFPGFSVGSRYVPKDMLAVVHQGEGIVRKKDNPYANSGGSFWSGILTSAVKHEITSAKNYPGVGGSQQTINYINNNIDKSVKQDVTFADKVESQSDVTYALERLGRDLAFG